jgi:hypothetical protein
MNRKSLVVAVVVLALLVGSVGIAYAITNGVPDGNNHPYVALLVFGDETDDGFIPWWRCSGALIAPDVILTAGHCTSDGATGARVWFDAGPIDWGTWDPETNPTCAGEEGYPCSGDASGTPYTMPGYGTRGGGLPGFDYHDVGIVVLTEPVPGDVVDEYAQLPTAGLVDTLKNKTEIDFVGYGVQEQIMSFPGENPYDRWTGLTQRFYAPSELISGKFKHSDEFMKLSLNASQGDGGTCFGDSGGPDLLGGTGTVLAVNSYVTNANCKGVGYSNRVDTPEILAWINEFLQ